MSTTTVTVHHGMFCWFEHHSRDPIGAAAFWVKAMGHESQDIRLPDGGTMHFLHSNGQPAMSTLACPTALQARGPHWLPYIAVDDIDAAHASALAAGANEVVAPHDNPAGRASTIIDPQGAVIGLFTAALGKTDGVNVIGHGYVCWCELVTADPVASTRFYETVLGWSCTEQHMPGFTVVVARAGGAAVASIFKRCDDDAHAWKGARWYPYIQSDDIALAAARVKECGGSLSCDAMEIPGIGVWQPTSDALGCETALLQPAVSASA